MVAEGGEGGVREALKFEVSGDAAGDGPGGVCRFPAAGYAEDEGLCGGGKCEQKKEPAQEGARGLKE